MKKNGNSTALLVPGVRGWRLSIAGSGDHTLPSLDEAIAAVPAGVHLELALPCQSVLLERHTLPATDRAELADMLQLQLEKTLPFPVEEVTHGFEVLGQSGNESTILSIAAHHDQLDQICGPLRARGRLPGRITLNALRYAAACPAEDATLALWPEGSQLVVAVISNGKLAWAESIDSLDPESVIADLPGMLLTAEVEGVSTAFQSIRLSTASPELAEPLAKHFGRPVEELPEPKAGGESLDLLPPEWEHEAKREERFVKLKQNLLLLAVVYLVCVAAAFIYLAWLKKQVQARQAEYVGMKPKYAVIDQQMERWKGLAPAVEPGRYAAEVLHQLTRYWPKNQTLQFTNFTFNSREWILKGEGTTDSHFEFCQKLKKADDLSSAFRVDYPPPQNLKDEKVSFIITGKTL